MVLLLTTVAVVAGSASAAAADAAPAVATIVEATYHGDLGRTGFTAAERSITPANVSGLAEAWTARAGGVISGQAAVVGGVAYWGDWAGNEHATSSNGASVWTSPLGQTIDDSCNPTTVGVASSPTVGTVGGQQVVWTGTGNGKVASLAAATGQVLWETQVAPSGGGFVWSSPAVFKGSVYIGVSSFGDCPLVRGRVVMLNAQSGTIEHVFYTAPAGCLGDGVWSSPAVDAAAGALYVTTGNASCSTALQYAMVKLRTSDLALESSWQIPASQLVDDSDWGSSPTLFTASVNGVSVPMVGSADKNGIFYAFDRATLGSGPAWQFRVAIGGDCPQCGSGSISPASFDGARLFVAGAATTVDGASCAGSIDALSPATGTVIWRKCLVAGAVLGAVTEVPGLVFVGAGPLLLGVSTATGVTLFAHGEPSHEVFYAPPTVAGGTVYAGNTDGVLSAFKPPTS